MRVYVPSVVITTVFLSLLICNSVCGQVKPVTAKQIQQLIAEKKARTGAERKISSQLLQAVREANGRQMATGVQLQKSAITLDAQGSLQVDINATVTNALLTNIKASGGTIIYSSVKFHAVRASIKLSMVQSIAAYSEVNFIKPAARAHVIGSGGPGNPQQQSALKYPTFKERAARIKQQLQKYLMTTGAGAATSEGDHTMGADSVRNIYGYQGQGIRIGVLSDSYDSHGIWGEAPNASTDVQSGDLPGPANPLGNKLPVTVLQDFSQYYATDEGRAMLQIVHDIAPKAQLFFATAFESEASFADNILALRAAPNNCDIIIDDVMYYDEPAYQDGMVAQAVNTVTADGAMYFSSAGNGGSVLMNYASVWEGDFNDAGSPVFSLDTGKTGTIHNFGTLAAPAIGDTILQTLSSVFNLKWADPLGAATDDYDLFIVDPQGDVKFASTDIQDGTQDPYEEIDLTKYLPSYSGYQLLVFKESSAKPVTFVINSNTDGYGPAFLRTTPGITYGHSSAADAFSVAATPAPAAYPGIFTASAHVEYFSSDGPRHIFFNADSTAITPGNFTIATNGGVVRKKPDITAADGVSTSMYSFNPFYGTSAAAPHAGAIAALLKSANKQLTNAQIRNILTSTALDIEAPGYDINSGYGIVRAFNAMRTVKPKALPAITLGQVTVTEGAFSNHNGAIDPGETCNITVQLLNKSLANALAANAVITSNTTGVDVIRNYSYYGNIKTGDSATNTSTPFTVALSSNVACNSTITFYIVASHDGGGDNTQGLQFSINTGKTITYNISSALGSVPPKGDGYKSFSGHQMGKLNIPFNASYCYFPATSPGLSDTSGSRLFDAYTFTNPESTSQCVTVTANNLSGTYNTIYTVAYDSAGFVPAHPELNYIGGPASQSNPTMQYSFAAPPNKKFTVLVFDRGVLPTSHSAYSVNVTYTNCLEAPPCTNAVINHSLKAGATGQPYHQALSATGGSGAYRFSVSGNLPPGITFNNGVLSGTPTQAGIFPFLVSLQDPLSCNLTARIYDTLNIAGILPASVAVYGGSQQSTQVKGAFAQALQAKVLDAGQHPLGGVNVIFISPPQAYPSGTFEGGLDTVMVITDSDGIATAPAFKADSLAGGFTVDAIVNGITQPAYFMLANSCLPTVVTNGADDGPGSLRYIVNNGCPAAIITFAPGIDKIELTSGQINIMKPMSIAGPGADKLAISGNNHWRIFVASPVNPLDSINLSGISLRDGVPGQEPLFNGSGGGAIYNARAILSINSCIITNCDASFTSSGSGGGIYNYGGSLFINNSSIVKNKCLYNGAGIINYDGRVVITYSTIANNIVPGGVYAWGGGIYFGTGPSLSLVNCTIYGNAASIGANVYVSNAYYPSVDTLKNTIIAGGVLLPGGSMGSPDLYGSYFTSLGHNLVQDATGAGYTITNGFAPTDLKGVDPALLPLGNYGGPTPTLLPMPSSPVIGNGDNTVNPLQYDQRGYARIIAGRADIGAVETNYSDTVLAGTPQSATVNTQFAIPLQVQVNESGNPIDSIPVVFTAPPGNVPGAIFSNSKTADTVITNAAGTATTMVTANTNLGTYKITGNIGTAVPGANFYLTNTKSLAVTFGRITAAVNNCTVQINWQTLTGEPGESFTVEHSTDGVNFKPLYTTTATGNSAAAQNYGYTHLSPDGGANYYRIKQTDVDGSVIYSGVILAVNACGNQPVIAYPNPAHNMLTLVMPGTIKQTVTIFDAAGKRAALYTSVSGTLDVDVSHWANGVYTLMLRNEGNKTFSLKIVKD